MNEQIVKQLRGLGEDADKEAERYDHKLVAEGGYCPSCSLAMFGSMAADIADKLEAQSAETKPEPTPETAEEETARLSLKFCKWADLLVQYAVWRRASVLTNTFDRCRNLHPAEPLTVDAVLEELKDRELSHWRVGPSSVFSCSPGGKEARFFAHRQYGTEIGRYGQTPLLALLRALDAAGVMDKDRTAEVAKVAKKEEG